VHDPSMHSPGYEYDDAHWVSPIRRYRRQSDEHSNWEEAAEAKHIGMQGLSGGPTRRHPYPAPESDESGNGKGRVLSTTRMAWRHETEVVKRADAVQKDQGKRYRKGERGGESIRDILDLRRGLERAS
jgi:hypothetical protein